MLDDTALHYVQDHVCVPRGHAGRLVRTKRISAQPRRGATCRMSALAYLEELNLGTVGSAAAHALEPPPALLIGAGMARYAVKNCSQ